MPRNNLSERSLDNHPQRLKRYQGTVQVYGRTCKRTGRINHIWSLMDLGRTRSSNFRINLFVCSARLRVRMV